MQERSSEGPVLKQKTKVIKQKICQSLNKKIGTQVEKSMIFQNLKNKYCFIRRKNAISGKPPQGDQNVVPPKSSRSHISKAGKHIHKIIDIQ